MTVNETQHFGLITQESIEVTGSVTYLKLSKIN